LADKPGLTFNQFGGSAGGPIKRDKIFIFGVFEGYRERAFTIVQETLMTARLRDEALAVTPSYKMYLDFIPLPNQPTAANADTGLYIKPTSGKRDDNHADLKSDIRIGANSTLSPHLQPRPAESAAASSLHRRRKRSHVPNLG
jgi:hypothetical protein